MLWVQVKPLVAHSAGFSGNKCCGVYCYDRAIYRPTAVRSEAMPAILGWASLSLLSEEQSLSWRQGWNRDLPLSWNPSFSLSCHLVLNLQGANSLTLQKYPHYLLLCMSVGRGLAT